MRMKIKLKELFRKKEDDLDLDLDEELNDPDILSLIHI